MVRKTRLYLPLRAAKKSLNGWQLELTMALDAEKRKFVIAAAAQSAIFVRAAAVGESL
jgi:hypothetical protein